MAHSAAMAHTHQRRSLESTDPESLSPSTAAAADDLESPNHETAAPSRGAFSLWSLATDPWGVLLAVSTGPTARTSIAHIIVAACCHFFGYAHVLASPVWCTMWRAASMELIPCRDCGP